MDIGALRRSRKRVAAAGRSSVIIIIIILHRAQENAEEAPRLPARGGAGLGPASLASASRRAWDLGRTLVDMLSGGRSGLAGALYTLYFILHTV